MTIVPPGYADCSVELQHSTMTRPAFITLGVQINSIANDAVAEAVLQAVLGPTLSLQSIIDTQVTIMGVTARIGTDGGEGSVYTAESTGLGLKSLSGAPPNVACLVHKRTARGGRRGRGRFFVPFVLGAADVAENGIISTSPKGVLQAAVTQFLVDLNANGVPMVVLHNASEPGTEHPTATGVPNLVTSLQVDSLVSTQRRRLGR